MLDVFDVRVFFPSIQYSMVPSVSHERIESNSDKKYKKYLLPKGMANLNLISLTVG